MEVDSDPVLSGETKTIDYGEVPIKFLVPGWSRTVMAIYMLTAMLIGVPGNSLVLFVLSKPQRKTSTDWFVIFIALCDVISLLVHGTISVIFTLDLWNTYFLCKFDHYFGHFVFLQSSLFITCVGVDRYMKTCKPHSAFFTPKSALIWCFIIIIVSAIFNISHIFTTKTNIYGDCILDSSKATIRITLYSLLFIIFSICSVALGVMYGKIAIRIRRRIKVGQIENTNLNNVQKSKTHTSFRVFSRNNKSRPSDGLSLHSVNSSRTEDQKAGTKNSGVADDYITSKSNSYPSNTQGIFNISGNKVSDILHSPRGLNKGASTSAHSAAQKSQPLQLTSIKQHEKQMTKQINKTTKIMGAITLVFIISFVVPTSVAAFLPVSQEVKQNPIIRVVIYFLLRLYMISYFANPLFYIWLSSNFRKKVIEILKVCKR